MSLCVCVGCPLDILVKEMALTREASMTVSLIGVLLRCSASSAVNSVLVDLYSFLESEFYIVELLFRSEFRKLFPGLKFIISCMRRIPLCHTGYQRGV